MNSYRLQYGLTASFSVFAIGLMVSATSPTTTMSAASPPLDAKTHQAMIDAINDEFHARAFYTAVIQKFGTLRPFSNIVQAENRHVQHWETLFQRYGIPIPQDTFADRVDAPQTLRQACQMGIDAEIANIKLYDNFLNFVQQTDLRDLFTQLRSVSENNHKPAFERCLQRQS
ncbi:MAG: DUF2202 domain-containing protein [Alkalinema sp. CACIAM 70d]|uniref:ferritin-like domain-containing protein n=1 Tax=Alkalinema sp. FACHB-956 TaxID=2692768 RepID=UPI000B6AEC52|nr:DUF2202 domain-containing protein [Alkalinema sp. FACHB-956]MBD2328678.1 DUF2202 domain-containing protein [Alkalinema sp. FACHB-956]OUC14127.1 MAG: DUF2202 domain-containing protein [Alkalinema sp. CACIAM 70d]